MTENIRVLTHNSIRIESGSDVIYVDPFQVKGTPRDASFILITHDHYDHFSPEDIAKVAGDDSVLVVPEKMERKAKEAAGKVGDIYTVKPGEDREIGNLHFETVPAYNLLKPFHPKSAGWVGYVLMIDGKRIYIAGDTDATKEAKSVKCDIILVPVGGTYTMDAKKAAELVNEIEPEVTIPTHYGNIVGKKEDGEHFSGLVKAPVRVDLKMEY